ncbi:MAG: ABC transporter ATP-binding protein [Dehalococcoidales bacterium]|nr:ABC transporter ATP-binding protein [Dehalococcoidales bacterium]
MSIIRVENVSKSFGRTVALNNVSLTFEPDKIYGLLGRNGAGKTTLINIVTNKIFADGGRVTIDGENAEENDRAQSKICCMTEKNVHPWVMKVKNGFRWAREFYPGFDTEYADTLARKFKLDTDKRIKDLSSGYSSIFKLILTLASGTPILIFDEPILGLDAAHRELFYQELIAYYSEHPKTIIIATHMIGEVADILERVIILHKGEVVLAEPVEDVLQMAYSVSGDIINVDNFTRDKKVIREEMIGKFKAATIFQQRDDSDRNRIEELGLEITPARLQEVFISLTNAQGDTNQ